MNIKEAKTAFKVADAVLDKEHGKNYIRFIYLSDLNDETGEKLDKTVLRDDRGRVYLIVVDSIIKKIGGSMGKGGIINTLSFYQSAMQGRPSLRNYGIHILIKEEPEKKRKVEIYMIISSPVRAMVKGLFSQERMAVSVFKEMEQKCQVDYFEKEKEYPVWNFQERGEPWPMRIKKEYTEYMNRNVNG